MELLIEIHIKYIKCQFTISLLERVDFIIAKVINIKPVPFVKRFACIIIIIYFD